MHNLNRRVQVNLHLNTVVSIEQGDLTCMQSLPNLISHSYYFISRCWFSVLCMYQIGEVMSNMKNLHITSFIWIVKKTWKLVAVVKFYFIIDLAEIQIKQTSTDGCCIFNFNFFRVDDITNTIVLVVNPYQWSFVKCTVYTEITQLVIWTVEPPQISCMWTFHNSHMTQEITVGEFSSWVLYTMCTIIHSWLA